MSQAIHSNDADVSFKQAFGNTTLSAGASGLTGCASTESGISSNNIDWGECTNLDGSRADDPYSALNIIHEFGHVLQYRNDRFASASSSSNIPTTGNYLRPRETWERMLTLSVAGGADYSVNLFQDVHTGFATQDRQNTGQGGRNSDEEVADMFLFWIVPSLMFSQDRAGELRRSFVNGFAEQNYNSSGLPLLSLGMKLWIERAAGLESGVFFEASRPSNTVFASYIPNTLLGQCGLPFSLEGNLI